MLNTQINLDHRPDPVTLEPLPDGGTMIRLYKNISELPAPGVGAETEATLTGWMADEVAFLMPAGQEADAEQMAAQFDSWWTYGAAWTPESNAEPTLEQRVAALEAAQLAALL